MTTAADQPDPPSQTTRVSPKTVDDAITSLLKWKAEKSKTEKPQLLAQDEFVYLTVTLKKIPQTTRTNAHRIRLPHPLINTEEESPELCLIIDDRPKSGLTKEDAVKKIESENIPITKVLKLSKLKTDYKAFEAKRKLFDSYEMFFADRRVIPMLPRLIGKKFFVQKKIPLPVDLKHKNWKQQIEKGCGSAMFFVSTGGDKAFELVEMLEERGIRLNYKTCCVLIHGFVKESRVDKGVELFEKMRGMGMEADIALYDVLIGELCKVKDLERALSLYLEMKKSGVRPDRGVLGKLIRSFSEESELSRITKVIVGDIDTKTVMLLYKTLLEGFIRNGLVNDAYSFVQSLMGNHESEIVQLLKDHNKAILPDSDTLSSVIDCLVKANKIDMAMSLSHVIVQNGLTPSLMMYNNIIEGLCKEGRSEESLKLLGEMKEPSQFTLNCIYGCLAERCDVEEAVELLKKMRFYGFEPWIKHSTLLVKKLCENGRAVDACKYLDDVAGEGFFNHMVAYTAAIDGLVKNEGVDRGLELFRDICASGHSPDVIAYNVMIKALCKGSRTTEADDLFNEMVSKGLRPSVATYNSMIDGWCKEGEIDRAMSCIARMYEDEKDPDVITYTSLIHGLCVSGRPSEAISRWNDMKSRDCSPNVITFMALVQGLCKCSWSSEALVYFREMEEKEMEPDSAVYLSLISSFLSSGNISAGFEIFREMVCKGRFPVLVDRNYLFAVDATNEFVEDYRTSCYLTGLVKDGRLPIVAAVSRK